MSGIDAADPKKAVVNALTHEAKHTGENRPLVELLELDNTNINNLIILAFGKAAIPMTDGALSCIPTEFIFKTPLVVTNYENVDFRDNMQILGASHPIPNNDGLNAAKMIVKLVTKAKEGQLVLALIS